MHSRLALATLALVTTSLGTLADGVIASDAATQANNPIADYTVYGIQNYYLGELTGPEGKDANQLWLRYAKPFSAGESDWLMRASLPVNTYPTSPDLDHETGLGDLNALFAYLFDTGNPAVSFGVGPQFNVPTGDDDTLGSGKWSAGLLNAFFDGRSQRFQYGYLVSWWASFAGDDNRADVNAGFLQPFAFYQLGSGTYLRAAPIWYRDFEADTFSVPVGIGVGQVIPKGNTIYNLFIEPQWSIADEGPGFPEWQTFMGLNIQMKN